MKCSHITASHLQLMQQKVTVVSYLGSRYKTEVSSHRLTPPWGKINSNHSSAKQRKVDSNCLKLKAYSFDVF